jgi:hypothetical protein
VTTYLLDVLLFSVIHFALSLLVIFISDSALTHMKIVTSAFCWFTFLFSSLTLKPFYLLL